MSTVQKHMLTKAADLAERAGYAVMVRQAAR